MASPPLQRKSQTQPVPPSSHRSLRSAPPNSGPSLKSAWLTLIITLVVSVFILRQLDIISSGEWPKSEHIKYLLSDADREALQAALKSETNGPLVLAFYSETCLACRRMRKHFLSCAEQTEGIRFYAAHITDPKNYNLAMKFEIKRIPAILVLNHNGPESLPKLYEGKPRREQLTNFIKTVTASQVSRG